MENIFIGAGGGGLWNSPRHPRYNKEAEELRISSASEKSTASKSAYRGEPRRTLRRNAEACRAGRSYEREMFQPVPFRDMEDEKKKLQNFMATGRYEDPAMLIKRVECHKPEESQKPDPIEEVLNEIEERKQFIEDMEALGQNEHSFVVKSEISQMICIGLGVVVGRGGLAPVLRLVCGVAGAELALGGNADGEERWEEWFRRSAEDEEDGLSPGDEMDGSETLLLKLCSWSLLPPSGSWEELWSEEEDKLSMLRAGEGEQEEGCE
ncbi:hypothetical protein CCH79_00012776 [Gambusia affinis]|uniref:Uncharacterized protein n=1 Tax=Gambusia affinis TaxID=33528 RepID=A0A315UZU2_GAMAF|nr:hypothetical protein CCH79_00012776 [Gambusia affinis]